jgi:phosphohistidine phosphatase
MDNSTSDYDRILSEVGINEAKGITHKLVSAGMLPDLMIVSGARLSLNKVRIIRDVFGLLSNFIEIHDELYLSDADKIFGVLAQVLDNKNSVMVISHNPGISRFLEIIINEDSICIPIEAMSIVEIHTRHWNDISLKPHIGRQ